MRVGVIGGGQMAQVHIFYLRKYRLGQIVGVCDIDERRAQETARKFRIQNYYHHPAKLIEDSNPEVVHVVTPPQTHAALAVEAMEAGCHVFVEKPMALSVEQADHMIAVAKRTRKKLCVDHNHLFDPIVLEAKNYLTEGRLGQLLAVDHFQGFGMRYRHLSDGSTPQEHWLAHLAGGAIQDIAPHSLAFLLEFAGIPRKFHVAVKNTGVSQLALRDEIRILAEGEKTLGSCALSLATQPYIDTLTLYGSEMTVEARLNHMTLLKKTKERRLPHALRRGLPNLEESAQLAFSTSVNAGRYLLGKLGPYPGVGEILRRFYRSIELDENPPVTPEHGREVVRLMETMIEAMTGNGK